MGTNVYFYKKISEDIKKRILEDLSLCSDFDNMKSILNSYEEEHPEFCRIHVGKRSSGWKFLFAREILRYCEPNKESILNWLSTGEIINEYGDKITPEEFWQDYVVDFQAGMMSNNYYKKYPGEEQIEKLDEMIGDLRFTNKECWFS